MLYANIATDAGCNLDARHATRPALLVRLGALRDTGRRLFAGPHPAIDAEDPGPTGFTGGSIVAEFDSLEAAQTRAEADPYMHAGVYGPVIVKPFHKVAP